jgi:hypothetical protein
MTRKTVPVIQTEDGRRPDATDFEDAVYWDDDRPEAGGLDEGQVSIIPL